MNTLRLHAATLVAAILIAASTGPTALAAEPPVPMALGLTYNRSTLSHQNGIGLKLQADLGSRVRIEPEMIYFAEHDSTTALHLNMNLHWRIGLFDRFGIYPLAGVSYSHWGYQGPNASRWGANLGCGAEYRFMKRLSAYTELRLLIVAHETQPIYTVGLKYHFR